MSVTEFAIRRWQLTLVLFTLLCALGYSAFTSIPRAVDPHFPLPVVHQYEMSAARAEQLTRIISHVDKGRLKQIPAMTGSRVPMASRGGAPIGSRRAGAMLDSSLSQESGP